MAAWLRPRLATSCVRTCTICVAMPARWPWSGPKHRRTRTPRCSLGTPPARSMWSRVNWDCTLFCWPSLASDRMCSLRRRWLRPSAPTPAICWRPPTAAASPTGWPRCCPAIGSTLRWARPCTTRDPRTRATPAGSTPTPVRSMTPSWLRSSPSPTAPDLAWARRNRPGRGALHRHRPL